MITATVPPAFDPLIGVPLATAIGELIALRILGEGGFATVYAGQVGELPVAIKVLHAEHIGSRAVTRFAREIAVVRRLCHPNIAEILHAGVLPDGRPFYVMEQLAGHDLESALESGPLPTANIVEIVDRVADALGAAHRARVIHRDVKAANVFLCDDGRVVLLDFGIAKLALAEQLTLSREAIGTLGSMAPEQLAGQPVDERADVYALGALVHHMATGSVPFQNRDTAVEIQLHRFAQRPRPSRYGAPATLDPVVAKAMAIRATDRYASAADLAGAVRAALGAATRVRMQAVGIHLETFGDIDALHDAAGSFVTRGFRPLTAGAAGGVWWCPAAGIDKAPLNWLIRTVAARGVAIAVHVDDLDVDASQAAGGPLSELWRWVPDAQGPSLIVTPSARELLTFDP